MYSIFRNLALILISAKFFALLARKCRAPQVVGEIIAGLVIGPCLLNFVQPSDSIAIFAEIGVVLLMFTTGLGTNLQELMRAGPIATLIACVGVAVPLAGGTLLYSLFYGFSALGSPEFYRALFIGTIMTATSVSITVATLQELGKLKSFLGTTIVSAAVIDDVIGIVVLTCVLGASGGTDTSLVDVLMDTVLFFIAAIVIGGIICVIAAIAGDTSQDLKTGFLVGATPKKQQIGEMIGVVVSAVVIGAILYLLSMAWGGYGSDDLPAPQAMLMKMIVEGVMGGNLPWNLVFTGVFIAIVVEILGIPVLPFAIGLYLPIYLSVPMMLGGALRWYLEKRAYGSEKAKNDSVQSGVLYSSGLIAGEGIVGILLAVLAIIPIGLDAAGKELYLSDKINLSGVFSIGSIGGLVCFAGVLLTIYFFATKDSKKKSN